MNGTWNYDSYNHGLANGLILAKSILTGDEPIFLEAPSEFLSDKNKPLEKTGFK